MWNHTTIVAKTHPENINIKVKSNQCYNEQQTHIIYY